LQRVGEPRQAIGSARTRDLTLRLHETRIGRFVVPLLSHALQPVSSIVGAPTRRAK
jgi:hypothetical protein